MTFEDRETYEEAIDREVKIGSSLIRFRDQYTRTCHKCGDEGQLVAECAEVKIRNEKWKAEEKCNLLHLRVNKGNEGSKFRTYAEASKKGKTEEQKKQGNKGLEERVIKLEKQVMGHIEERLERMEKRVEQAFEMVNRIWEALERNEEEAEME